jgi:hypothetical protein
MITNELDSSDHIFNRPKLSQLISRKQVKSGGWRLIKIGFHSVFEQKVKI